MRPSVGDQTRDGCCQNGNGEEREEGRKEGKQPKG